MNIINVIGKYKQANRTWYQRQLNTIKWFTVHHTASLATETNEQILSSLMSGHVSQGWVGLAYHEVIMKDGTVYLINNFSDVTWHDSVNWDSYGIVLHGYFHPTQNQKPTTAQLVSLRSRLDALSTKHPEFPASQANVLGHRERASTACPGDALIGYVTDYRNKLGKVDWGKPEIIVPPVIDPCANLRLEFKATEENMKKEKDKAVKEKETMISNLKGELESANVHLKTEQDANLEKRETIKKLEEDVKQFNLSLSTMQAERDEALAQKVKAENEAKSMVAEVTELRQLVEKLKEELDSKPIPYKKLYEEAQVEVQKLMEKIDRDMIPYARLPILKTLQQVSYDLDTRLRNLV